MLSLSTSNRQRRRRGLEAQAQPNNRLRLDHRAQRRLGQRGQSDGSRGSAIVRSRSATQGAAVRVDCRRSPGGIDGAIVTSSVAVLKGLACWEQVMRGLALNRRRVRLHGAPSVSQVRPAHNVRPTSSTALSGARRLRSCHSRHRNGSSKSSCVNSSTPG
jgi:hypothetical protein